MVERGGTWLVCGAVLLLAACADSHGGEGARIKPGVSTETGNPPVIDVTRVALVVKSADVHVEGEPGAVTPGGTELQVETLSSGELHSGTAKRDGSFDITVGGTLDDTYVLHALAKSASAMSAPVYLYRGGAMVGEADGGTFSCDQRASVIEAQFAQLAEDAERSCSSNSDCTRVQAPVDCPAWACAGAAVSHADEGKTAMSAVAIGEGSCQAFDDDGCWSGQPSFDCATPAPIACIAGQCVDCALADCSAARCEPCDIPELIWAVTGPQLGPAHSLINCTTFVTSPADAGMQCTSELPCVSKGGTWSTASVQNAIGDPVVQAALAADASYGPNEPAGVGVQITIGSHAIRIIDPGCDGAADCTDPPYAVQSLRALLDDLAHTQACSGQ